LDGSHFGKFRLGDLARRNVDLSKGALSFRLTDDCADRGLPRDNQGETAHCLNLKAPEC
jgi:hypothetical protein